MCLPGESLDALDEEARAWELLEPWDVGPENATMIRHAGYRFHAALGHKLALRSRLSGR